MDIVVDDYDENCLFSFHRSMCVILYSNKNAHPNLLPNYSILVSFGHFMQGMGQIFNILWGNAGHRNSAILGQINAKFLGEAIHLKYLIIKLWNNLELYFFTCSGPIPVKQNIPIWLTMWSQFRFEPFLTNNSFSWVRIVIIRSAIPFTSISLKL